VFYGYLLVELFGPEPQYLVRVLVCALCDRDMRAQLPLLFLWVLLAGYARATSVQFFYAAYVAAFTPIVVLLDGPTSTAAQTVLFERTAMTFLGVLVAMLCSILPWPGRTIVSCVKHHRARALLLLCAGVNAITRNLTDNYGRKFRQQYHLSLRLASVAITSAVEAANAIDVAECKRHTDACVAAQKATKTEVSRGRGGDVFVWVTCVCAQLANCTKTLMLYDVEPQLWHSGVPYEQVMRVSVDVAFSNMCLGLQSKHLVALLTHVTRRVDWILMSADREGLSEEQRRPRDELLQVNAHVIVL
jgi:hypothetical protein